MRTRRRRTHRRRVIAAILAALVVPAVSAPGSALALPADQQYPRPVPQTSGPTPSAPTQFAPQVGDTKFDSPGASRAPQYDPPTTIQVVRPERTIVRNTGAVLPIAISGAALLVALGLAGTALVRVRSLRLG
jgi:energy-converting hydrogenase Eha subunit F